MRDWDLQHLVGHQLMTAQDASQHITIAQTARDNSVFSADHGNARMMITESRETRKRRQKTPTVTSAAIATPLEVTQDQEQNEKLSDEPPYKSRGD